MINIKKEKLKILDFYNAETWKIEVLEFLRAKGSEYQHLKNYEDFQSKIVYRFEDEVFDLLQSYSFRAWHFSRILNVDTINQDGLTPLTIEFYEREIFPIILSQFEDKEKQIIQVRHDEYKKKSTFLNRENQIWFTSDKKFLNGTGVERFWKTYGGEYSMTLVNSSGLEEGIDRISRIGDPYAFELEIPFSKIDSTCKTQIMKEFLDHLFNPKYLRSMGQYLPEGYIKEKVIPVKAMKLS